MPRQPRRYCGELEAATAEARGHDGDRAPEPDWDRGVSLRQLFASMAIVGMLLAVLRLFPPAIAAGVAGLMVLVGLLFTSLDSQPAIVSWIWWMLLSIYLLAASYAAWQQMGPDN